MGMSFVLEQQPETRQTITPQFIEANQILTLSAMELERAVLAELERNPALEPVEAPACARCGAAVENGFCPTCRYDQRARDEWVGRDDDYDHTSTSAAGRADPDFDPMTLIASDVAPVDRLLSDVATLLDERDRPIAEYLLNSLDERGYLTETLADVAAGFNRPLAEVERVLRAIQQVAPPGVGARGVAECLLLQLEALERLPTVTIPPGTRQIVTEFLEDLAAHRYSRIARRLGLTTTAVGAVHDFIRASLTPCPLQNQEGRSWKTPIRAPFVAPDVVVSLHQGELQVEVVRSRASQVRLAPFYAELAADLRHSACSRDERTHVRQHVSRARLFLMAINQRHETLKRISTCLVELQRDFILNGVRELRPLTRGMVAEYVGVHESTVSRATAEKYLMLPNREVIPFSTFFSASLSTKDIIRELIEREQRALTDEEICTLLQQQGVRIARRTVAKYRATLGILPSTFRQGRPAESQTA
jgi:RNA polymerase sigma-54 factor